MAGSLTTSLEGPRPRPRADVAAIRMSQRVAFVLIFLYLFSQSWGIPLVAVSRLNWGVWPTPADIIWLLLAPLGAYLFVSGVPTNPRSTAVRNAMVLFVVYALIGWTFASIRLDVPRSQMDYLLFSLFRLVQAFTVWAVAAYVPMDHRRERRLVQALIGGALVVSIAAILQEVGLLAYEDLVAHLPSDPEVSGAWSPVALGGADAALGTLNYNRIYTAHFLAAAALVVFFGRRFSAKTSVLVLMFLAGMLFTQSRSSFIALLIGLTYGLFKGGRISSRIVSVLWIVTISILIVVAIGLDPFGGGAIAARSDTFSESMMGRFTIQQSALPLVLEDPLSLIFGIGFANVGFFVLGGGFSPAHGQYVTVLTELGVVGLALFVAMYLRLFRSTNPTTSMGLAARAVLAAVFASAVFNDLLLPSPAFGSFLPFILCIAGLGSVLPSSDEDPLRPR